MGPEQHRVGERGGFGLTTAGRRERVRTEKCSKRKGRITTRRRQDFEGSENSTTWREERRVWVDDSVAKREGDVEQWERKDSEWEARGKRVKRRPIGGAIEEEEGQQ